MKSAKYFLAGLLLTATSAFAIMEVHEVANHEAVSQTIDVSSVTPTNMTSATSSGTLAGAFQVEIYNVSVTSPISCGFSSSVSTISSEAWYGREITMKKEHLFQINPSTISVFCLTHSTNTSTRATVTQFR